MHIIMFGIDFWCAHVLMLPLMFAIITTKLVIIQYPVNKIIFLLSKNCQIHIKNGAVLAKTLQYS